MKHTSIHLDDCRFPELQKANKLEEQFARVWTQCQSCQGSFHQVHCLVVTVMIDTFVLTTRISHRC